MSQLVSAVARPPHQAVHLPETQRRTDHTGSPDPGQRVGPDPQWPGDATLPAAHGLGHSIASVRVHADAAETSTIGEPPAAPRPAANVVLRRACACTSSSQGCDGCGKQTVRRQATAGAHAGGVPGIVHEVLRSPGASLDATTRAFMEPRFGHDFGHVRVHADGKAAESARAVGALAYTVGHHIALGAGQLAPGTERGLRLLSHELAHVAQQTTARSVEAVPAELEIGHPAAPEEGQADAMADAVMSARTPSSGRSRHPEPAPPVLRRACPATGGLGNTTPAAACAPGSALFVRGPRLKFCTDSDQLLDGQDGLFRDWVTRAGTAATVELHGNASEEGPSKDYNERLSCHRASAMADKLKTAGVAAPSSLVAHSPTAVYGGPLENRNVVLVVGGTTKKAEENKPEDKQPEDKPKAPAPDPQPAPPRGKNVIKDCTPGQKTTIEDAMSRALSDLDGAIASLAARPLSEHAESAMFMAFRISDDKAADDTLASLKKIRAGLPSVTIECDQPGDVNVVCRGDTAAATNIFTDRMHLCMKDWDASDNVRDNPRTLVHEGAHAFAGAPGRGQDPYFSTDCDESDDTSKWGPGGRIGKADPLACVVYNLTHRSAEEAKDLKQLYSGAALTKIIQTLPKGPISLAGPEKRPGFILATAPIVGGFTFRWRLFDDSNRHYLLRGRESDEALDSLAFTDQRGAIIGSKTRELLAQRGVRAGVIECTARIPVLKGGQTSSEDKTLRLDVTFTD